VEIEADLESAAPDLPIGRATDVVLGAQRRVGAWARRLEAVLGMWRRVEAQMVLSAAADLLQIIRSVPCRPDSGIGFPDVATMKAWKKLTAILKKSVRRYADD
jgi:hypothetical protein